MKKGFTLLEILVVIGIIGVLVSVVATSYSTAQQKSRDAKRKGDLRAIQNCLEQYYSYNNNFKYPVNIADGDLPATISCGSTTLTTPADPKTGTGYQASDTDSIDYDTYTITATLESVGSGSTVFTVSQLQ